MFPYNCELPKKKSYSFLYNSVYFVLYGESLLTLFRMGLLQQHCLKRLMGNLSILGMSFYTN